MKNEKTFYHTLRNGIRIVHKQTNSKVSWLGLMIGAGTRDEQAALNGMAHYIEHTVFKGTEHRSAKQIIDRIEDIGGEINAYTTKEETTFYAAVPQQYFGRALELIADMVFHPSFPVDETKKELNVIFDEIESYEDSPSELIYDDFESIIFSGHPLEMPVLGNRKSLRRINKDKARQFMLNNYNTDRTILFSLSSLPFQKVIDMAEKYLSQAPYTTMQHNRIAPTAVPAKDVSYHRHTHQTHVMLGGRAYPIGHPQQPAMYLLNHILGGSMNSRLNMALREQRGLAYNVESIYTPMSDTGYWCAYFASDSQHAALCEELVRQELRKLCDKPVSQRDLKKSIRQLHGQMAIAAENQENSALRMGKLMLYLGEVPEWENYFEAIGKLTPPILQQTAQKVFQESNISVLKYR